MKKVLINQKSGAHTEWTEFSTRACRGPAGQSEWQVECHVEHFLHRFGAKNGRTHLNYPTMSIEEATALRDNLTEAIDSAARQSGAQAA